MDEVQRCLETWVRARGNAVGRAAGDEAARRLYAEWSARLPYMTPGMDPDDRRDCLQEAVVKAVCGREGSAPAALAPEGYTPAQWRNAVLRNAVKDFKRARGRRTAMLASVHEGRSPKLHATLQALVREARAAEQALDHSVHAPELRTPTRDADDRRHEAGRDTEHAPDPLDLVTHEEIASLRRDQVLATLADKVTSPPRAFYVALRLGYDTTPWHTRLAQAWDLPLDEITRRVAALGGETDLTDPDLARLRFGVVTKQGIESEGKTARRGVEQLMEALQARYGPHP